MDEDIDQFIEVSNKKNNSWWRNLNNVTSFYKTHIDVFKDFATKFFNTNEVSELQSTATAKTCPAIGNGLLNKIILIKLPCDVMISINEQGSVYWNARVPNWVEIRSHGTQQFYSNKKNPFFNKINIKFVLPVVLSTNKDTFMFLQPQFHQQNYPFEVVNGSVNKDRVSVAINTVIDIPKEQTEYHLKAGTILSYMWFDNNNITLEKNDKLKVSAPVNFFGNK